MLSDEKRKQTIDNIVKVVSEKRPDTKVYVVSFEYCTFRLIQEEQNPTLEIIEHYFNPNTTPPEAMDKTYNGKRLSYRGDETGLLDVLLKGVALEKMNGAFMEEAVPIYSRRIPRLDGLQDSQKNKFDDLLMYVAKEFDALYSR